MNTAKQFEIKRQEAIKTFKKANYDPYTIFISLQALGLDTKEDAKKVICYLKKVAEEKIKEEKKKCFSYTKKKN